MTDSKITFTDEFGRRYLKLRPINFDILPQPHKRAWYTTDLLPAAIYVAF